MTREMLGLEIGINLV